MLIRANYSDHVQTAPIAGTGSASRKFLRSAILFVFIGFLLYLGAYVISDQLIYKYAKRNRFYTVKTAAIPDYDYLILGASHAAVFDYEDMNATLEQMTGKRILNLSIVGSGVTVNRLVLDYFLLQHKTSNVVYVADSFGFYSRDWNEDRLQDVRLFDRAPFDPALVELLLGNPTGPTVAFDYLSGFSKINNSDRFMPDISDDEATKFNKTYRPVPQIDAQRIAYLYPQPIDQNTLQHYLTEFENTIHYLKQRNIRLIVIKPPIPSRVYQLLPEEHLFDQALKLLLDRNGVDFHDFSLVANDEKFFFNPDHLNRAGVMNFFQNYLCQLLVSN